MKNFRKYITVLATSAALLSVVASCNNSETGAGDAKIGFEKASYSFKESAGLVKIRFAVTGEPKSYPISFDVTATSQEGDDVATLLKFTQSEGLKYVGNEKAPAFVEFTLVDNDVINDTKHVTLAITNLKGAELQDGLGTAVLNILDNDNNPYDKLMGDWTFTGEGLDEGDDGASFPVNISGGFTEDEMAENADKKLVVWGWESIKNESSNADPTHFAVWYINYDEATGALSVEVGTKMLDYGIYKWNLSGYSSFALYSASVVGNGFSQTQSVPATFSEDFNTITFDPAYGFAALLYGDGEWTEYYYSGYQKIVLKRAK